jgi:transposase InsO family protein
MKSTPKKRGKSRKKRRYAAPYDFEFKLKVVRLYLEEKYRATFLEQELGVSSHTINKWARTYKQEGEDGLKPKVRKCVRTRRMPESVAEKILELKKAHPEHGPRRISDVLKRFFLIKTSAGSVQKTLSDNGLTTKAKRKPVKNAPKPRFFERSRPNQLWQSDIMTFRLGGKNAYLIGFLDDYSRFMVGLGLYRSQTAAHVLETYRRAVAEVGVPREILTDNGRQYTNWRGKTRFEKEMAKDRVKHIRSRPHHPMTLGKIERFWKSILGEFLQRAQFDSFEQAVERTTFWIKYYNYKRPHQGIGGLCPADRFFEIQHELKKTLERGIEENALELTLRGRPMDPFYMVGRMGDQSVVIRAEKGKVKMLLDGQDQSHDKELVYDTRKDIDHEDSQTQTLRPATEDHRRPVSVDREAHHLPDLPGDVHQPDAFEPVAKPGHGGDALGPEPQAPPAADPAVFTAVQTDREEPSGPHGQAPETIEGDPGGPSLLTTGAGDERSVFHHPPAGGGHHEGALRAHDGHPGGPQAGHLPQDLLQMGEAGIRSASQRPGRQGARPPEHGNRSRKTSHGGRSPKNTQAQRASHPPDGAQGGPQRFEDPRQRQPGQKKISASRRRWP